MSADREKYFYSMRDVADAWADRGWSTDMPLVEFVATLVNLNPRALERTLLAGTVDHLCRVEEILGRLDTALGDVLLVLRTPPELLGPRRDPIADGALAYYLDPGGGLEALDVRDLSAPARRAIRESGCQTPGQLARYGAGRLLAHRNIGVTRLDEIRQFLRDRYRLGLAD